MRPLSPSPLLTSPLLGADASSQLAGLAALAVCIKDARDDGHALPIGAELANTLIPTLYAVSSSSSASSPSQETVLTPTSFSSQPIIVHLPSTLSATVAAHNQKDFAEGADHAELSTDLRQPFEVRLPLETSSRALSSVLMPSVVQTSAFSHPFSTIAGDEGGEIVCHLKFSPFPLDHSTHPRLYDSLVHVVNVGFATHLSYLSPWAVAAEHLVLGAPVHAAFAAAYMVRLAVSVGTQMASAAAAGAGRRLGADEAATLLGEALDGMLGARGGRAVLETWIERFGRSGWALSMQLWEERVLEVHRNELARQQHLELYERLGQFLLPVLKVRSASSSLRTYY